MLLTLTWEPVGNTKLAKETYIFCNQGAATSKKSRVRDVERWLPFLRAEFRKYLTLILNPFQYIIGYDILPLI